MTASHVNMAGGRVVTVRGVVLIMRLSVNCVLRGREVYILENLQETSTREARNTSLDLEVER